MRCNNATNNMPYRHAVTGKYPRVVGAPIVCGVNEEVRGKYKAHAHSGKMPMCMALTMQFSKRNKMSIRFTWFHIKTVVYAAALGNIHVAINVSHRKWLVGQVGFEPTTLRLKGECSAVELLTQPHPYYRVKFCTMQTHLFYAATL